MATSPNTIDPATTDSRRSDSLSPPEEVEVTPIGDRDRAPLSPFLSHHYPHICRCGRLSPCREETPPAGDSSVPSEQDDLSTSVDEGVPLYSPPRHPLDGHHTHHHRP